jgi:hypothetical protein
LMQIAKTIVSSRIGLGCIIALLSFLLFKEKTKAPPAPQIVYQEKIVYKEKEEVKAKVSGTMKKHTEKKADGSEVSDLTTTFDADINALWEMTEEREKILSLVKPDPRYSYGLYYHLRTTDGRPARMEGVLGTNLHKYIDLDLLKNTFIKFKADVDPTKPLKDPGFAVGLEINR